MLFKITKITQAEVNPQKKTAIRTDTQKKAKEKGKAHICT